MSATGLKTIDSDDIYCTSLTVSGINIITSLNNLNITSSNNSNALSTYSNLNIENLKFTSTTIFNKTDFNNLLVAGNSTFYNNLNISGNTNINNVLAVRGNSLWGYATLNSGFLGNQVGHVDFFNVSNIRKAYIGWEDTLNYLTMACENGLLGYRIRAGGLIIDNNLNVTGTSLINGVSTFLSTLNVVGNITTSGISVFNLNTTSTTIFNN